MKVFEDVGCGVCGMWVEGVEGETGFLMNIRVKVVRGLRVWC